MCILEKIFIFSQIRSFKIKLIVCKGGMNVKIQNKTGVKLVIGFLLLVFLIGASHVAPEAEVLTDHQYTEPANEDKDLQETAAEIHKSAWLLVVDAARTDPYYKYALYASRVLAVSHPEVYLKADSMFLDAVDNTPLTQAVVRDIAPVLTLSTFDIDFVELSGYHTMSTADFYGDTPVLPYLDRRAFSLSSTVRRFDLRHELILDQDKITQLNKAVLYYLKVKREVNAADTYLIYCDNENAYIYCHDSILWAETLKEAPIAGNPVLIFNEDFVWYPLMDRDDTGKDSTLKDIVHTFSTDVQTPALDPLEEELIEDLKGVTALDDESQYTMAILSASKTSAYYGFDNGFTTNESIAEKWLHVFPQADRSFFSVIPPHPAGGVDDAVINEVIKRANYVSPLTAYLAAVVSEGSGEERMGALSSSYQEMGFSWCCLWTLGMDGFTIDEAFYTKGGTCQVHAYNIASVLDVAGIGNYILHGYTVGESTHQITYVKGYDVVFSNGAIRNHQTILHCPRALMFLSFADEWTYIVKNSYIGTLSPNEAGWNLNYLKEQHDDDIKGLSRVDRTVTEISYDNLMGFLEREQKGWTPIEIPMTVMERKLGECAFENLQVSPGKINAGEEVVITVDVTNTGEEPGGKTVVLEMNHAAEAKKYVALEGGETKTVSFVVARRMEGTYLVEVEGMKTSFTVRTPIELSKPCILTGVIVILIVVGLLLSQYMRKSRMLQIAVKKVIGGVFTLFLVTSMLFFLLHAVPGGDPVDRLFPFTPQEFKEPIREEWGLNEPLIYQYATYMRKVFTLNLELFPGAEGTNAFGPILFILPLTLLLFGTAALLSYLFGTILGIVLLSSKRSRWRSGVTYTFIGFYILPAFVLGIFFKSWLVFKVQVFPPVSVAVMKGTYAFPYTLYYGISTIYMSYTELIRVLLPEMVLPLIVLVLVGIARPLLLMRDQMTITLGEPHILTARAKGLTEKTIRFKHVARCALLPLVNDASINLVYIFGGGILIEYVFSWPGVGLVLFEALKKLNYPFISACIFILTCVLVVSMIAADLLSAYLDPRIGVVT